MKFSDVKLPSDKKFGLFFSIIFLFIFLIFIYAANLTIAYIFLFLSIIFLSLSLLKPELLNIFNKAWMFIGFLINKITSPIILGVIFFGLFTPISIILRVFGRDELRLKLDKQQSNWTPIKENDKNIDFEKQF